MHNMTDMNPPSYICIMCTPHFADGRAAFNRDLKSLRLSFTWLSPAATAGEGLVVQMRAGDRDTCDSDTRMAEHVCHGAAEIMIKMEPRPGPAWQARPTTVTELEAWTRITLVIRVSLMVVQWWHYRWTQPANGQRENRAREAGLKLKWLSD